MHDKLVVYPPASLMTYSSGLLSSACWEHCLIAAIACRGRRSDTSAAQQLTALHPKLQDSHQHLVLTEPKGIRALWTYSFCQGMGSLSIEACFMHWCRHAFMQLPTVLQLLQPSPQPWLDNNLSQLNRRK